METPEQTEMDFGHFLKAQRRSRNMDLETLSQKTKIRVALLRQIENEDFDVLPEPVFTKGFIRSYAEAVGADGLEAIRRYEVGYTAFHEPEQEDAPDRAPSGTPVWRGVAIIVVLIGLAAAAVVYFQRHTAEMPQSKETSHESSPAEAPSKERDIDKTEVEQPKPAVETAVDHATAEKPAAPAEERLEEPSQSPMPTAVENIGTPQETSSAAEIEASPAEPVSEPPAAEQAQAVPAGETGAQALAEPVPAQSSAAVSSPDAIVLKIDAVEMCWMKISVDDHDPQEVTLRQGEQAEFRADTGFKLLIGNAGGVQLTLNDQPVEVPGRSGQVIRMTLP